MYALCEVAPAGKPVAATALRVAIWIIWPDVWSRYVVLESIAVNILCLCVAPYGTALYGDDSAYFNKPVRLYLTYT